MPRTKIEKYVHLLGHEFAKAMIRHGRMPAKWRYLAGKEDWVYGIRQVLTRGYHSFGCDWLQNMEWYEDWYIALFDFVAQHEYPNRPPQVVMDPRYAVEDPKQTYRYLDRPGKLADEIGPYSHLGQWIQSIEPELWELRHPPADPEPVPILEYITVTCLNPNCRREFETTDGQTTCSHACTIEKATGKRPVEPMSPKGRKVISVKRPWQAQGSPGSVEGGAV